MHTHFRSLAWLLLASLPLRAADPIWTNLPHGLSPTINELNSVAFGNGLFVAIKSSMTGSVLHYATSPDGTTWTARTITTSIASSGSAQRVRFLNGKFLIMPIGLGAGGAGVALALTSADGLTWTSATVGTTTTSPDEMDFGQGRVLAGGSNNYFIGSTNFANWTGQTPGLQGAFAIQDVAFGNNRWFITTNGGGEVATSTDGTTFTKVNGLSAPGGYRVEYGNGVWFFYSQQNNAVSSDGVNFTAVTRTNTTPGGTGNIRFVNGRFLAYGATAFQASTDGQTWTNFGTPPSLGSGFVWTAIYDYAYGNGKYVAVGGRDFPATAALIWSTDGGGSSNPGGGAGEFTLAFQLGATPLPGSTAPTLGQFEDYALHNGGVAFAIRLEAVPLRSPLLQFKNGALSYLLNSTGGFPGGGDIHSLAFARDGSALYVAPRKADGSFGTTHATLLKLENGTTTTLIPTSSTLIEPGSGGSSQFIALSVAAGRIAMTGVAGNASNGTHVHRHQNSSNLVVAQKGVTTQPGGTGTSKFDRFGKAIMGADGRVFFDGYNAGNFTLPDFRRGLYVEQGGAIARIADNATLVPGTTKKFNFVSAEPVFSVSPDGSKVLLGGADGDHATESERNGLYLYTNGTLTTVVDNTMSVTAGKFSYIDPQALIMDDGTVFFYASVGSSTNLYRAKNGTIELFVNGAAGSGHVSPAGFWIHNGQLFFHAYTSGITRALFRKPIDGSSAAQVAIDLKSHPDFKAINAGQIEDLQFANDQVLVVVGAVKNGIERSALLYGPASAVLGGTTSTPTTPQPQSVTPGGSATLTTATTGTIQWQRNGSAIAGATNGTLSLSNVQPTDAGIYTASITNGATVTTESAIVGLSTASKVIGAGTELSPANIVHPNGNTFDQVLLTG
ncbi:MAG TPA: hypothetical protein VEQ65_12830, partial [Opitutus sp.]|nr:hypothetical protein [Opitutus sp.]